MAIDYKITANELVKELGGNENIVNVTHCATRLRFILNDEGIVDSDKVKRIQGVITTVQASGQYQVVIGNHVKDAFDFVMELVDVDGKQQMKNEKKVGVFSRIIDESQEFLHHFCIRWQRVVFYREFLESWWR